MFNRGDNVANNEVYSGMLEYELPPNEQVQAPVVSYKPFASNADPELKTNAKKPLLTKSTVVGGKVSAIIMQGWSPLMYTPTPMMIGSQQPQSSTIKNDPGLKISL